MMQNTELKILAILRRNDANFVEKLLTRVVNLEKTMHKNSQPHADQSKGLTTQNTAGTSRCGDYTTASRQIQGEFEVQGTKWLKARVMRAVSEMETRNVELVYRFIQRLQERETGT